MIDMEQLVKIKISNKNKEYYREIGYVNIKSGDMIYVKLKNVHDGFKGKVEVFCDGLGIKESIGYKTYLKLSDNGLYYSKAYNKAVNNLIKITNWYDKIIKHCNTNNYELLTKIEDIRNNNDEVKYICKLHGMQITKVRYILDGHLCPKCAAHNRVQKRWDDVFDERKRNLVNKVVSVCNENNYSLITNYDDINFLTDYIEYNCEKHGIHKIKIANLLNGHRCPECRDEESGNRIRLSVDEVKRRIENCGGVLLNPEDYISAQEKNLKIICPLCKTPFITSLHNFIRRNGQLCPNCASHISLGEMKIRNYLEDNKINYNAEYIFPDCRDKNPLRFDFYLEDKNIAIEYDGKQHFGNNEYFSHDNFEDIKRRDNIKTQYCINNNIKLIRIPYWDYENIEIILDELL